jgi:endonuclease/exonuclease/phosphatase family metal-dependent hydrolase
MSFNIRYGSAEDGADAWPLRRAIAFDVLRGFDGDVVGVQEALRFQLDEIAAALPAFGEIGVGRDDGKAAGEYSAILYRRGRFEVLEEGTFWFSDAPATPGSMSWGNRITRICTWARLRDRTGGAVFYVYNLHLDHESQPSRERSAILLAERIRGRSSPDPVIVMGDFNSGEANPAYRHLTGSETLPAAAAPAPPLADTYRARHPRDTLVGTFHGFRGTATGDKIDHILASPEWLTLDASIVRTSRAGRFPSDHFPVTAVVRLRGP